MKLFIINFIKGGLFTVSVLFLIFSVLFLPGFLFQRLFSEGWFALIWIAYLIFIVGGISYSVIEIGHRTNKKEREAE